MLLIGSAGHIDHGKSALVQALTGKHPSRLPEEKARGMTIDLGYAHLQHPDGYTIGFVDVPGHERLIKNMVAGATGMGVAILVVDAREGPMAQTFEHLNILRLLGVKHVIPVITKTGIAEDNQLQETELLLKELLASTPFNDSEIYKADALDGRGVQEIKEALFSLLTRTGNYDQEPAYLPIDRSFQLKGIGTVVTGTLFRGRLQVQQEVKITSLKDPVRIRSLHNHNQSVDEIASGHRVGVQIPNVHAGQVSRGDVLLDAEAAFYSDRINVRLSVLGDSPLSVKNNRTFLFHTGCVESVCRLWLKPVQGREKQEKQSEIPPGGEAYVQLQLETGTWFYYGQRFLLRSTTPLVTIGGGEVMDSVPDKPRRLTAEESECYLEKEHFGQVSAYISRNSALFHSLENLSRKFLFARGKLNQAFEESKDFVCDNELNDWQKAEHAAGKSSLQKFAVLFTDLIKQQPELFASGINLSELSAKLKLPLNVCSVLLREFLQQYPETEVEGKPVRVALEKNVVRLQGMAPVLPPGQEAIAKELMARLQREELKTTYYSHLKQGYARQLNDFNKVLKHLKERGELIEISRDYMVTVDSYNDLLRRLAALKNKSFTVSDMGRVLDLSRKYTVPLAEYLDRQGITERDGNNRVIKSLPA